MDARWNRGESLLGRLAQLQKRGGGNDGANRDGREGAAAEQLTEKERWKLILSAAFRQFLGGKVIGSTGRLADAPG